MTTSKRETVKRETLVKPYATSPSASLSLYYLNSLFSFKYGMGIKILIVPKKKNF